MEPQYAHKTCLCGTEQCNETDLRRYHAYSCKKSTNTCRYLSTWDQKESPTVATSCPIIATGVIGTTSTIQWLYPENQTQSLHRALSLTESNPLTKSWIVDNWKEEWSKSNSRLRQHITEPSKNPPAYQLPRRTWVRLIRVGTGWAYTLHFQKNIGARDDDICDCGLPQTL